MWLRSFSIKKTLLKRGLLLVKKLKPIRIRLIKQLCLSN
jgi:hypothetical protein